MNFEIVKKHPFATGAAVLFTFIVVYVIVKHSSRPAQSSGGSDLSGGSAQLLALQSGQNAQNAQINAQLEMAQIGAQVQQSQTQAQLDAVRLQTEAAKSIVSTQTQGATDIATVNANATTQQTQINADRDTQVASIVTNAQLQAAESEINAQQTQAVYNHDIALHVVNAASFDHSRSSTGWAQILSALQGQGPQAIAANQPSEVAGSPANIIGSVAKLGSVFASFF